MPSLFFCAAFLASLGRFATEAKTLHFFTTVHQDGNTENCIKGGDREGVLAWTLEAVNAVTPDQSYSTAFSDDTSDGNSRGLLRKLPFDCDPAYCAVYPNVCILAGKASQYSLERIHDLGTQVSHRVASFDF